jgi:hypothetical protein
VTLTPSTRATSSTLRLLVEYTIRSLTLDEGGHVYTKMTDEVDG